LNILNEHNQFDYEIIVLRYINQLNLRKYTESASQFFTQIFKIISNNRGYRIIRMDYEAGNGQDNFLYNMDTSGPVVRFGFNF
jgi:hypothetical protein